MYVKSRRGRSYYLTVALVLTVLLCAALFVALLVQIFHIREKSVCTSKQCIVSSAGIIESMDSSQDPCKDFYSFVCGGFVKKTYPNNDRFQEMKTKLYSQVKELMEMPSNTEDPVAIKKARFAYKICLNLTRIMDRGFTPLKEYVKLYGGWPLADGPTWTPPAGSSLEKLFAQLERNGLPNHVVSIGILPDPGDPTINRLTLDQLGDSYNTFKSRRHPEEKPLDETSNINLSKTIITAFGRILSNNNTEQFMENVHVEDDIQLLAKFQEELQKIVTPAEERKNQSRMNNKMTILQLHELTNNEFNWYALLQEYTDGIAIINENEEIIVKEPNYIRQLPRVLKQVGRRTVTNYAIWKTVELLGEYVTDPTFSQDNMNQDRRWKSCLTDVSEMMFYAMWRLFADKYMDEKTLTSAAEFMSNLDTVYKEIIAKSDWLDSETKATAVKKTNEMTHIVGYPRWIMNDERLDAFYKEMEPTEDHFTNMITAGRDSIDRSLLNFRKPVNRNEWPEEIDVLTANAYYYLATNAIFLPGGLLQPPFYSVNQPQAMNYGSIGAMIGHEIGHAFDTEGSQLDDKGMVRQWWTEASHHLYKKRTKCFVDQYNQYCFQEGERENTDNGTCVDGLLTLGENVPDNTGVQCAFKAYKRWVDKHGPESKLPGLEEFTSEQLFFINYASTWCENITPQQWFTLYKSDEHSPGKYRVLGPLSNFAAFSQTFNCSNGSMNRESHKCTLW